MLRILLTIGNYGAYSVSVIFHVVKFIRRHMKRAYLPPSMRGKVSAVKRRIILLYHIQYTGDKLS